MLYDFLCSLIGFAYPMYASCKAIASNGQEDDTQWLTYWVVFGLFTVIESISDFIWYWLPFYYEFKLLFLIALQIKRFQLAPLIYENALKPIMDKYGPVVDKFVDDVSKDGFGAVAKLFNEVAKFKKPAPQESEEVLKRRMVKVADPIPPPQIKKDQ